MFKGGTMYILKCADDTLYVGSTNDLESRLWQHAHGEASAYTRRRLPVELVYTEDFDSTDAAFYREKQVQGWSRAKRDALIEGRAADIKSNMPTSWEKNRAAAKEPQRRRPARPQTLNPER